MLNISYFELTLFLLLFLGFLFFIGAFFFMMFKNNERISNMMVKTDERISSIEKLINQNQAGQDNLNNFLRQTTAISQKVIDRISTKQAEHEEHYIKKMSTTLEGLSAVMIGSRTKGKVGENILDNIFKNLPYEFYKKDLRINGKVVEYVFCLPSGKMLPVDSKIFDTDALSKINQADGGLDHRHISTILNSIQKKAKDITEYLKSDATTSFALMVVPDSIFDIAETKTIQDLAQTGIMFLKYSLVVPYLLSLYQLDASYGYNFDRNFINDIMLDVEKYVDEVINILDTRLAKSLTMGANVKEDALNILRTAKNSFNSFKKITHDNTHSINHTPTDQSPPKLTTLQ